MVQDDDTVRQDATLRGPVAVPRRDSDPVVLEGSRYTIRQLIGEGGMGEVHAAIDEQIGREVAVKRTRAPNPTGEELARFLREARVQGRLEHPAVVPVHDLSIDATGRPFFVMKRLTGEAMSEVLQRLRAGDEKDEAATRRRLLRAFAEVCLAVEFAHKGGIIHRDLKPANIMLGDFGEVYVIDWGIARAVTEPDDTGTPPSGQVHRAGPFGPSDLKLDTGDTRQGTVLGTPAYMSPEQLVGDRVGPAADIYALGCILFEIAAGSPLHAKLRSFAHALQVVDCKPSSRRSESPPELDAICERALAIEAAARYPSARALGDAVQAFLDGDRDVAVRKELALRHIAEARAELAKGDGDDQRQAAMRAAGRALALDPTASEAGDIVTRLMLEPPKQMPQEVERSLEALDTESAKSQGRLAAISMLGYLAFIPILFWTGVRDASWIPIFAGIACINGLHVWWLTHRTRIEPLGIYMNTCINAVLIGIVCRIVGPLIIAPTLVATTMVAYAAHPKLGRLEIVAGILMSAVAVPWILELAGVIAPTYQFVGGSIVLSSPIVEFSSAPVQVAFALLLVTLVTIGAVFSRSLARNQRDATRKLELQAWQLRQIVPSQ